MSRSLMETARLGEQNTAEVQPSPWMTTREACEYLRFTGSDRLNSLYRFIEAKGIRKRYRSPKRLLLSRADIDAALAGVGAARRRNVIKLAQGAA